MGFWCHIPNNQHLPVHCDVPLAIFQSENHVEASSIQLPRSTTILRLLEWPFLVTREHGSRAAWIYRMDLAILSFTITPGRKVVNCAMWNQAGLHRYSKMEQISLFNGNGESFLTVSGTQQDPNCSHVEFTFTSPPKGTCREIGKGHRLPNTSCASWRSKNGNGKEWTGCVFIKT